MLISTNRRIIIQYGIMMKGGYSLHRTSLSSINSITLPVWGPYCVQRCFAVMLSEAALQSAPASSGDVI